MTSPKKMDFDYTQLAHEVAQKGVQNPSVLAVIANTPRHQFMPEAMRQYAEEDTALPIDANQTISQPYVVARMTECLLEHGPLHKVLEIGTGSGYQGAVLSQVADEVYTIERIEHLHEQSKATFARLGNQNIHTRHGDGHLGWPEEAPFDGIIVTAATASVPPALLEQLNDVANLIIPVGDLHSQQLLLITRRNDQFEQRVLDPVRFVPLLKGTD